MSDYARKITPICCHAYRVNRVWEETENRWVNRLTIEPQTFCGLKEIELKTRKIQQQNQQCVTITQPRLANKKRSGYLSGSGRRFHQAIRPVWIAWSCSSGTIHPTVSPITRVSNTLVV